MHSGEPWRLGHRPALDGLRGVAILLVVISHLGIKRLEMLGSTGVTVFFTLSGFLISALLLEEADRRGAVSFRGFYRRRFFRLAPAFLLMLAVVVPLEFALFGAAPYWWTTVLEVGNWIAATKGAAALLMLHHTWSLAIEEQFYLVWPVVLWFTVRRFGRGGVIAVASVGAAASIVVGQMLDGPRQSYGTDSNAASLLAGCLLAALMVNRSARRAPLAAAPLGLASIATGVAVPVGAFLVIWSLTTRGTTLLAWAPLRGAGLISYGWYLWNYPLTLFAQRAGVSLALVPAASLAFALVSWYLVERPILALGRQRHGSDSTVMVAGPTPLVLFGPPA